MVQIGQDLLVREAQDGEALRLDLLVSPCVVFSEPSVLLAVELDDELALEAHEIDCVGEHRHLTLELQPVQASSPQRLPQRILGSRRNFAQLAREASRLARRGRSLTPAPLPFGRGVLALELSLSAHHRRALTPALSHPGEGLYTSTLPSSPM